MLPKSSEHVRAVIQIADEVAREYDQEYVGTEHVLLAISREGKNLGARMLRQRGLTEAKIRKEVDKLIKVSLEETWVFGRLPGTPHFKNVMATATEQCQALGAPEVNAEHLLLALLKESGSVANKALGNLGVTYTDLWSELSAASGAG